MPAPRAAGCPTAVGGAARITAWPRDRITELIDATHYTGGRSPSGDGGRRDCAGLPEQSVRTHTGRLGGVLRSAPRRRPLRCPRLDRLQLGAPGDSHAQRFAHEAEALVLCRPDGASHRVLVAPPEVRTSKGSARQPDVPGERGAGGTGKARPRHLGRERMAARVAFAGRPPRSGSSDGWMDCWHVRPDGSCRDPRSIGTF